MDLEKSLLGLIVNDNSVFFKHQWNEELFFIHENKRIYKAIEKNIKSVGSCDLLMLTQTVENVSADIIASLTNSKLISANSIYHFGKLVDANNKRKLLKISEKITRSVSDISVNNEEIVQSIYDNLGSIGTTESVIHSVSDLLIDHVNLIEDRFQNRVEAGIKTGLKSVDDVYSGFKKQRLIYIGARPSQGKSALMLTMVNNICASGHSVGVISLESGREEILDRLIAQKTLITTTVIESGMYTDRHMRAIIDATGKIHDYKLYINDTPNMDIGEVLITVRRMVELHKCEIVFVDYIGLISGDNKLNKIERVGEISKSLKTAARLNNIPIVILSQITRDADAKHPQLRDFSDTSQIEKDADTAIAIYNKPDGEQQDFGGVIEQKEKNYICFLKNRDGRAGIDVEVYFNKKYVLFTDLEKKNVDINYS